MVEARASSVCCSVSHLIGGFESSIWDAFTASSMALWLLCSHDSSETKKEENIKECWNEGQIFQSHCYAQTIIYCHCQWLLGSRKRQTIATRQQPKDFSPSSCRSFFWHLYNWCAPTNMPHSLYLLFFPRFQFFAFLYTHSYPIQYACIRAYCLGINIYAISVYLLVLYNIGVYFVKDTFHISTSLLFDISHFGKNYIKLFCYTDYKIL